MFFSVTRGSIGLDKKNLKERDLAVGIVGWVFNFALYHCLLYLIFFPTPPFIILYLYTDIIIIHTKKPEAYIQGERERERF